MTEGRELQQNKPHVLTKPSVRCMLALLSCALWGAAFPSIKIGYEWLNITDVGGQILFAGYRFFLAGIITLVVGCIVEKRLMKIEKRSVPHVMGIGLLQTTVQYVCFYIGMSYITGSKGAIINSASTFAAIILAHFLIKGERLTLQKGLGCIIGFAGVIIVNLGGLGGEVTFLGEGMVLLCAIAYGVSSTFVKMMAHRGTPMAITAYQLLFGGLLLIVIGFAAGGWITGFDLKSVILLIFMAIISSVGFSIWTALLKYNPVGKVAIFGFSIPVFGVILSAIFLGEAIFTVKSLGALLFVSAGIIIVNLPEKQKKEVASQ